MALNQTKTIQLLRSSSLYVPTGSGSEAKTALENAKAALIGLTGRKDGEIVLARYQEASGPIKSVLGIYHDTPDLPGTATAGWTFIQDVTESEGSAAALQAEIDQIETSVGLGTDGTYAGYTGDDIVNTTTTLDGTVDAIIAYIKTIDKSADAVDGKVVTTISQADGKVSETKADLTDVKMGGYTKDTTATGAIAATDTLEVAVSKLENAIAAGNVHSNDQSITVAADSTNGGTNIEVKVDGTTIVKDGTSHALKSGLTLAKITTGLSTNVKEAYQLQDASGNQIGSTQIDIYKDSALKEVYLGASTDTIDSTTGTITKNTVSNPQSMNFAYQLADGTYSLTKVDVSKFLTESEFSDGLQVNGGVVSVKKDTTSGKVRTAATPTGVTPDSADDTGLVDVLTVSSNGVKVDNIQAAINYAVQNSSTSLAISAEGDNYITAAVDANNNKKINVTADVQSLTATAGTAGTYDTDGAQTAAPTHGTLSGVANSLGDTADIATKVKTYVDGEIAIEAARSDAKNKADLKAAIADLDGSATATAASGNVYTVLTSVTETDGVISKGGEVTLAAVAKTGAASDVALTDTAGNFTNDNVESALAEIVESLNAAKVVANDVITVDTSNNTTKLAVTTGNGLEKSSNTLQVKDGSGITVDSNGVSVNTGNGLEISSDAVAIKIDSTSAMADSTYGMLTVSANGLKLNNTWDCGTF